MWGSLSQHQAEEMSALSHLCWQDTEVRTVRGVTIKSYSPGVGQERRGEERYEDGKLRKGKERRNTQKSRKSG